MRVNWIEKDEKTESCFSWIPAGTDSLEPPKEGEYSLLEGVSARL